MSPEFWPRLQQALWTRVRQEGSQHKLGFESGMAQSTIARYLAGKRIPSIEQLDKMGIDVIFKVRNESNN